MDHVLEKRAQRTTIVVATSGDTGGAAVDAFARPSPMSIWWCCFRTGASPTCSGG